MRQIGVEQEDPLKRIQEEINEVARRERELREKQEPQLTNSERIITNTESNAAAAITDDGNNTTPVVDDDVVAAVVGESEIIDTAGAVATPVESETIVTEVAGSSINAEKIIGIDNTITIDCVDEDNSKIVPIIGSSSSTIDETEIITVDVKIEDIKEKITTDLNTTTDEIIKSNEIIESTDKIIIGADENNNNNNNKIIENTILNTINDDTSIITINDDLSLTNELKETVDDPHTLNLSDDSGISGSSSPINGTSTNINNNNNNNIEDKIIVDHQKPPIITNKPQLSALAINSTAAIPAAAAISVSNSTPTPTITANSNESCNDQPEEQKQQQQPEQPEQPSQQKVKVTQKYFRSNTVHPVKTIPTPSPSQFQPFLKLTRTMSTPQMFTPGGLKLNIAQPQKGIMQRFIASRGKIAGSSISSSSSNSSSIINNGYKKPILVSTNSPKEPVLTSIELNRTPTFVPQPDLISTPPLIERDSDGRPIRRGYIPVEEKIQRELRDLKTRESELKKIRRQTTLLRQSQTDLTQSDTIDSATTVNGFNSDNDDADSEKDEDLFPTRGKLKPSKSISELCHELNNNASPRDTPSPQLQRNTRGGGIAGGSGVSGGMRPAVSLAQLCDVAEDEAPSSHRLIAQWENMIQQRQEVA